MSSKNNLRLPPQDIDAEKSVLGSILLDKEAIINIVDFLRPEHFYKTSHQNIFHAMVNLYEKREPIDVITLQNELNRDNKLEESGGVAYLTELVYFVSSSANSLNHARLIQESSMRRNLISSAAKLTELAYEEDTVSAIIDKAEQNLFSIYKDNTQIDCAMNLLEKYKSKNTEIIEAYDEDKEFYILNNRKCIGFRKDNWFKQFNDDLDIENKFNYNLFHHSFCDNYIT